VDEDEMFSRSRKKALVDARYLIIYIARQLDIQLIYIQRFFKLKGFELHYTTLFHATNRIGDDIKGDEYMKEVVNSILLQFDPSKVIAEVSAEVDSDIVNQKN
tara:strand:- start:1243 stop:1551 length:309 start_codon:yes stop_codon:yes gene_type:complete